MTEEAFSRLAASSRNVVRSSGVKGTGPFRISLPTRSGKLSASSVATSAPVWWPNTSAWSSFRLSKTQGIAAAPDAGEDF
jgi:hypothetical protein